MNSIHSQLIKFTAVVALATGAQAVPLVFGPLNINGNQVAGLTAGTNLLITQNYIATDAILFDVSGIVTIASGTPQNYSVNAAGVTVAAVNNIGLGAEGPGVARQTGGGFPISNVAPTAGSLQVSRNGGAFVQLFSPAAFGSGSPTPPTSFQLSTTVGAYFAGGLNTGDTLTFAVSDNNFADNGGAFQLAALGAAPELDARTSAVPVLFFGVLLGILSDKRRRLVAPQS